MGGVRHASPRRRRLLAARLAPLVAAVTTLAFAPPAAAGQIVWSTHNAIWAMNDDGTMAHRLLSAADPHLAGILPQGTIAGSDVFQAGGTTVLFLGSTQAFAPLATPSACGQACTDTFALRSSTLTDLGPAPGPLPGSAYYEAQPRMTADGQELFSWSLRSGVTVSGAGTARTELAERPIPNPQDLGAAWSDTTVAVEPASGFDGAPDPADPTMAAWVEQQGCGSYTLNGAAACQFRVLVGARGATAPQVSIYDDEYSGSSVGAGGPTSLDWSADGSALLMVDPYAPNDGIYEFAAATPATPGKPVTEVLAQPAGWTFNQARFAGPVIVFDAHQGSGARQTGDIFTVPASCTAASCSFPGSATNLTNDPPGDASHPSWTSATAPIAPFAGVVSAPAGAAKATAARAAAARIDAGHALALTVTLTARATIVVTVAPRHHGRASTPLGSASFHGAAGANRVRIARIAGRRLAAGSYQATIRAEGSTAAPLVVRFTVLPP